MCSHGGQKTVSHPLRLNSGLLEKEKMLLITQPSFQALFTFFLTYLAPVCLSIW